MKHLLVIALILGWGLTACKVKGEADMLPSEKEFLSTVRYLISKQERKAFLNLAPSERQAFIEDFWKKRDPDPFTDENEFRKEYFDRIEEANRLFHESGSHNGWLTDRGRIFILLGPPERRDVYPSGYSFYEPPVEIWYYGFFPILFIDVQYEGIYKLEPGSARQISVINTAQMQFKPQPSQEKGSRLDFRISMRKPPDSGRMLQFHVPYSGIRLDDTADGRTKQALLRIAIKVHLTRSPKETVWEGKKEFTVTVTPQMLEKLPDDYIAQWPLQLEKGDYTAVITVENAVDSNRVSKKINFSI
jgi:GWxTD domain-containing protein